MSEAFVRFLNSRRALQTLAAFGALLVAALAAPGSASAQGRCMRAYGTPGCNTDPIKPVFERTGWRTASMDHLTFRVADPEKEAAFYEAIMGWKTRSVDAKQVVIDMGDWGTAIFKKAPADSFTTPPAQAGRGGGAGAAGAAGGGRGGAAGAAGAAGGGRAGTPNPPALVAVEGFGFDIEPWNAKAVEAELKKLGLNPVADNDGKGYESFHVKDPNGFDLAISNGQGYTKQRKTMPANAKLTASAGFAPTGWKTVWLDHLSYGAKNYKETVSFYQQLLGWGTTYDEGSQNEVMIGDVGNTIIRGGNPLDPAYDPAAAGARAGRIDHISFGITPWDTDGVKAELEKRGLKVSIDTSDGNEIHMAQYKSYHTTTPNGYNLQISYNTWETRLNLATSVNPRRPGINPAPKQ